MKQEKDFWRDKMEERKNIGKRLRFEVFKRDKFTCQYCGRTAPDVILQVDHINPVSKGGTNDILNLITSCQDCNSGKSNIELSDDSAVKKQQKQFLEVAERKEQLEMMLEYRKALERIDEDSINAIDDIFMSRTTFHMSASGRKIAKQWIKKYSLMEILDAAEIAIEKYYDEKNPDSWDVAFDKIPGIIFTKKNDSPQRYYANYTIKALSSKGFYLDKAKIRIYVDQYVKTPEDFENLKSAIKDSENWTDFRHRVEDYVGGKFIWRW